MLYRKTMFGAELMYLGYLVSANPVKYCDRRDYVISWGLGVDADKYRISNDNEPLPHLHYLQPIKRMGDRALSAI